MQKGSESHGSDLHVWSRDDVNKGLQPTILHDETYKLVC